MEKMWSKNGENAVELIRKESGENPEKTKRDVGRTVFSCYCLFVGFPQIPATSSSTTTNVALERSEHEQNEAVNK